MKVEERKTIMVEEEKMKKGEERKKGPENTAKDVIKKSQLKTVVLV